MLYFPVDKFKDRTNVNASTEANVGTSTHSKNETYTVKKGETLYGIASRSGVTIDEIVELNPSANSGVKAGQVLVMPSKDKTAQVSAQAQRADSPVEEPVVKVEQPAQQPIQQPAQQQTQPTQPSAPQPAPVAEEPATASQPKELAPRRVALMLPFMLDSEKQSKQTTRAYDFYRGFLLAVDSLSNGHRPVEISTFDTGGSLETVKKLLASEAAIKNADIIIAPDDDASHEAIARFGARNDIYVLNPFIVKDSLYMTQATSLQLNISQKLMFDRAAKYMAENIDGATPIFISNNQGKREKQAFVDCLKAELDRRGIEYRDFEFNGNLQASTLEEEFSTEGRYVFIPLSGSFGEFAKMRQGLTKFKESLALGGGSLQLFGYPDWIAFRGENIESLHTLGATIYSRFLLDLNSPDYHAISDSFVKWYRTTLTEGVPSMGILGFDVANYVMNAFNHSGDDFTRDDCRVQVRGVQNCFNFVDGGKGFINNTLYIIRFMSGTMLDTIVL
jgi:LysM repeat protein